jgi:hypothetical protein
LPLLNVGVRSRLGTPGPLYDDARGVNADLQLVVDRSGGLADGQVYLVYVDRPDVTSANTDIFVRTSQFPGAAWSPPRIVNDDNTETSQFSPQIAIDQTTGDVAVAWYDARNSRTNETVELFSSVNRNGGITWQPNIALSDAASDAHTGGSDPGDYNRMDAHAGYFYPVWADNSGQLDPPPQNLPKFDMATIRATFVPAGPGGASPTNTAVAIPGAILGLANVPNLIAHATPQSEQGRYASDALEFVLPQDALVGPFCTSRADAFAALGLSRWRRGAGDQEENLSVESRPFDGALLDRAFLTLERL